MSSLLSGPLYNFTTQPELKGVRSEPVADGHFIGIPTPLLGLKQEKTWQVGKKSGVLQQRATLTTADSFCPLQSALPRHWLSQSQVLTEVSFLEEFDS